MNTKYQESQLMGQTAENLFASTFEEKGWTVTEATKKQNMFDHVDFFIEKDNKKLAIDVKAAKRIQRKDNDTQNEIIFVEYMNVRGDKGWIYGAAHYLAFQEGDTFLMIPREKLLERTDSLVTDKRARNAADSLYKLYTRFGRQDLITSVKREDIVDLHEEL